MSPASYIGLLDILPWGVIILNETGEVVVTNPLASKILRKRDGLQTNARGLATARAEETAALRELIDAVRRADGDPTAYRAMLVSRPSLRKSFQVVITRLAIDRHNKKKPPIVVLIGDPEREIGTPVGLYEAVYDFTQAEAKMAALLMEGMDLQQVCRESGVAITTVRTHLRHMLRKTQTLRQSELIQLLLSGPMNLEGDRLKRTK